MEAVNLTDKESLHLLYDAWRVAEKFGVSIGRIYKSEVPGTDSIRAVRSSLLDRSAMYTV